MCVISIKVDEAALRDMCPELNSTAAIRNWAQELVNLRILQMELENTETMSIEDARAMVHAAIHEEYAFEVKGRRSKVKGLRSKVEGFWF